MGVNNKTAVLSDFVIQHSPSCISLMRQPEDAAIAIFSSGGVHRLDQSTANTFTSQGFFGEKILQITILQTRGTTKKNVMN